MQSGKKRIYVSSHQNLIKQENHGKLHFSYTNEVSHKDLAEMLSAPDIPSTYPCKHSQMRAFL